MNMSEAKCERLLIDEPLRNLGYNLEFGDFQIPENDKLKKLISSKTGGKGYGKPEFLYLLSGNSDILVIEVKKSVIEHTSQTNPFADGQEVLFDKFNPKKYAEDGVVHYMNSLSKFFNVIGVAISGSSFNECMMTTFAVKQGGKVVKTNIQKYLSQYEYVEYITKLYQNSYDESTISEFIPKLHVYLRDKMSLSSHDKPLIISAILIALLDDSFNRSLENFSPDSTFEQLLLSVKSVLQRGERKNLGIQQQKIELMLSKYRSLDGENIKKHLHELCTMIKRQINVHNLSFNNVDLTGHLYTEFLSYGGGDKQSLGIVLTPPHVTSLFARLAELDVNSRVYDPCTGTGGFLIASMSSMFNQTKLESEMDNIRRNGLIGVEQDSLMYTLGCANMLLRGDGKSNVFNTSCLDLPEDVQNKILKLEPSVSMLNPPYSLKEDDKHELNFVLKALEVTKKEGLVFAIIPISCGIENKKNTLKYKKLLLENHSLVAVMSMPDDVFYPVGTNTCIMVFKAKVKHDFNKKVWFARWKDDGFQKLKNKRIEKRPWYDIKDSTGNIVCKGTESIWYEQFINQEVIPGISCKVCVKPEDEWLSEAYINVDYSKVTEEMFDIELKKYLAFEMLNAEVA
jgi:hypothetical protein